MTGAASDRRLAGAIIRWFQASGRDLPWRPAPGEVRDPWRALVSEAMLQQTQVARVAERFEPFMARFPTARALAAASEQEALAAWTGLGYYRRARLLHAAARAIVHNHAGAIPPDVEALRALPGVGRYTAGAIASICFGAPEPIVDANVARVLLRIDGREAPADDPATQRWLWERAASLVKAAAGAGGPALLNEGLMELGAVTCRPRAADCSACPVARACRARAAGTQDRIPTPKAPAARQVIRCASIILTDGRGRVLVDRRPDRGLWGGMWQAPTLEMPGVGRPIGRQRIQRWLGVEGLEAQPPFEFLATHRRLLFRPWLAPRANGAARALLEAALQRGAVESRFAPRRELPELAMSSPQRRMLGVASRATDLL